MLQIKEISKKYITGALVQKALDGVSLNLRDNEFVAVLGPSGSGKTTLLNVIGGLDRYDGGELVINGISTKQYKDKDWDSYRNHSIGFVFQSYNLISHQSILSNVELALTISGEKRSTRRRRAKEALEKVGLAEHLHKRPNQLSGGQMQRVAIARALVNDPDILLADEPTGALDTETSVSVMELLKEVANDRLVVMVTHNGELADKYATRIVKLRDGRITDDSDPYEIEEAKDKTPVHKNMGKASMSFFTSLSLSFNNLRTKKGRTVLTSFAGSIGIIGIALILSLSNGVNKYITDIQKSTMTSYPITIESKTMDLTGVAGAVKAENNKEITHSLDKVYSNTKSLEIKEKATESFKENNLSEFKKYLDNPDSEISKYVGENGIVYQYDTEFSVFSRDSDNTLVNTDGSTLESSDDVSPMGNMRNSPMMQMYGQNDNNFSQLIPGATTTLSPAVTDSYDVVYGEWCNRYDEVVLVLDEKNEISAETLYKLGLLPSKEYEQLLDDSDDKEQKIKQDSFSYDDICTHEFYMIPACDTYEEKSNGTFEYVGDDTAKIEEKLDDALKLKISGVIRPKKDADNASITTAVAYTKALTDYLINYTDDSAIVKAQKADDSVSVLNGMTFEPENNAAKISDAEKYLSTLGVSDKASMFKMIAQKAYEDNPQQLYMLSTADENTLSSMLDDYLENPSDDVMLSVYENYITPGSYDDNMTAFGVVSVDAPSAINIYADSFDDKDSISNCISNYNNTAKEENRISYTDYVALLMDSVTTIVNVISYVLIAFVAVSLIVSSIMIGIITYISVIERTKEIGILRAIGASKHNISQVFNAETFIIGLCSGLIGVGISLLLLIPTNAIIHSLVEIDAVNASLPPLSALILIVLSMVLTLIGGLIPSRKAAKKDPVTALRTD